MTEGDRVPVHHAAPPVAEPHDLEPVAPGARARDRPDRGVQAGRVAPGREDADACGQAPSLLLWFLRVIRHRSSSARRLSRTPIVRPVIGPPAQEAIPMPRRLLALALCLAALVAVSPARAD